MPQVMRSELESLSLNQPLPYKGYDAFESKPGLRNIRRLLLPAGDGALIKS